MSRDVIVDEVRRVRDQVVKRHGGLDGWIAHLQAMDRSRRHKAKKRTAKRLVVSGKLGQTRS
jgi:hypothetical protein